jgi:hypothetical protein
MDTARVHLARAQQCTIRTPAVYKETPLDIFGGRPTVMVKASAGEKQQFAFERQNSRHKAQQLFQQQ